MPDGCDFDGTSSGRERAPRQPGGPRRRIIVSGVLGRLGGLLQPDQQRLHRRRSSVHGPNPVGGVKRGAGARAYASQLQRLSCAPKNKSFPYLVPKKGQALISANKLDPE